MQLIMNSTFSLDGSMATAGLSGTPMDHQPFVTSGEMGAEVYYTTTNESSADSLLNYNVWCADFDEPIREIRYCIDSNK